MRTFLALLLSALAFTAHAETIVLPEAVCGLVRLCKSAGVEIRANTMYPDVAVLIGDETYTSTTGGQSVNGSFAHIGPLVLYFGTKFITLTAEFSTHPRTPTGGRGGAQRIWVLESATIERP